MPARFLYFLPGVSSVNVNFDLLMVWGIAARFTGCFSGCLARPSVGITPAKFTTLAVDEGPDHSGPGCVVAMGDEPIQYKPADQRWLRLRGHGFMVGVETTMPTPADLIRERLLRTFCDTQIQGQVWRIPLIQQWDEAAKWRRSCLNESEMVELQCFDALASIVFAATVGGVPIPAGKAAQVAAGVLALHYRIGIHEFVLLGLDADNAAIKRILEVMADIPSVEAACQNALIHESKR